MSCIFLPLRFSSPRERKRIREDKTLGVKVRSAANFAQTQLTEDDARLARVALGEIRSAPVTKVLLILHVWLYLLFHHLDL